MTSSPVSAPAATPVRRDRSGERRVSARRAPVRVPELAVLALDELRAYRRELLLEESRVSYWRRLLHARMDLVAQDTRSMDRVRAVLNEHASASQRLAMAPIVDADEKPPLPDLAVLWESDAEDERLLPRLADAEHELSAYRRSLHRRLDAATAELIARYREEPALALRALPLPRPGTAHS